MLGLQPLILGALADESRLTEDGIGLAATAELLTLGLTTGLMAGLLPAKNLPQINIIAAIALAFCNIAGLFTNGLAFAATRAAAGIAGGALVWIAISLITRAKKPERASGFFLTAQTLAQAGLAAILPLTLMPRFGANGGLAALAALSLATALCALWLPNHLAPLPKPEAGKGKLPIAALIGWLSIFFTMAGIVGLWVFVEQLGNPAAIGTRAAGLAVALALAAQVGGSALATLLASHLRPIPILCAAGAADIAVTYILGQPIGPLTYLISVALFGFLWLFAMPFQTRLLIDLDPTRRVAMLLSAAQLLGSATGPLITSAYATKTNLSGALLAAACLFATGILTALTAWLTRNIR